MALTKNSFIERYHITEYRVVLAAAVLEAFDDDGTLIGRRVREIRVAPGDDFSAQPVEIRRICTAVHTQPVIDAWVAYKAGNQPVVIP